MPSPHHTGIGHTLWIACFPYRRRIHCPMGRNRVDQPDFRSRAMAQASSECAACMSTPPAPGTATLAHWLRTFHCIFSAIFNENSSRTYFKWTARKRVFATVGYRCTTEGHRARYLTFSSEGQLRRTLTGFRRLFAGTQIGLLYGSLFQPRVAAGHGLRYRAHCGQPSLAKPAHSISPIARGSQEARKSGGKGLRRAHQQRRRCVSWPTKIFGFVVRQSGQLRLQRCRF
jgi:hypothetical protein